MDSIKIILFAMHRTHIVHDYLLNSQIFNIRDFLIWTFPFSLSPLGLSPSKSAEVIINYLKGVFCSFSAGSGKVL